MALINIFGSVDTERKCAQDAFFFPFVLFMYLE